MQAWRLDDHEARITHLESRPELPRLDSIPWLQIALLITALIGGLSGLLSPAEVKSLLKGVVQP
jgi:hypothetical protein